jgi:hypothetical protein
MELFDNIDSQVERTKFTLDLLISIILQGKRHDNYKRTCDLAEKYYKLITGDGIDTLLKRFVRREDDMMFKQRVELTKQITPAVTGNLMFVFNKVPRSNSVTKILKYDPTDEAKMNELKEILDKFYGVESLNAYLEQRYNFLVHVDPNLWIVTEFEGTDGKQRPQPYPFEVKSKEAIYYEKSNNVLQYLVVDMKVRREFQTGVNEKKEKTVHRYTIYTKYQAIVLEQFEDYRIKESNEQWEFDGKQLIRIGKNVYEIIIPVPYNQESVPAIQVGYALDLETDGFTYVNPFHLCMPYLEKSIKVVSELDITMCIHAFPQKIQAVAKCTFKGCHNGRLPDESICTHCSGSGFNTIKTAQDAIYVQMPSVAEEQIDLGNIINYVNGPVDILTFQKEYVEYLTTKCIKTCFNSDVFTKQEVSETATEKVIDLQNVYDTLYPFAQRYCTVWQFENEKVAEITELDKNLIVKYHINKDFKLKSKEDLMMELKLLKDSGANDALMRAIQNDIAEITYEDQPLEMEKYRTKEYFYPFTGKTPEQTAAIVSLLPNEHKTKVLWMFFGQIFDKLEAKEDFYKLERAKQRERIDKEVELLQSTMAVKPLKLPLNEPEQ